jgi:hypothetical protein
MIILSKDNEVLHTKEMVDGVKIAILFEEDKGVLKPEAADKMIEVEYTDYMKGRLERLMKVLAD